MLMSAGLCAARYSLLRCWGFKEAEFVGVWCGCVHGCVGRLHRSYQRQQLACTGLVNTAARAESSSRAILQVLGSWLCGLLCDQLMHGLLMCSPPLPFVDTSAAPCGCTCHALQRPQCVACSLQIHRPHRCLVIGRSWQGYSGMVQMVVAFLTLWVGVLSCTLCAACCNALIGKLRTEFI